MQTRFAVSRECMALVRWYVPKGGGHAAARKCQVRIEIGGHRPSMIALSCRRAVAAELPRIGAVMGDHWKEQASVPWIVQPFADCSSTQTQDPFRASPARVRNVSRIAVLRFMDQGHRDFAGALLHDRAERTSSHLKSRSGAKTFSTTLNPRTGPRISLNAGPSR